MESQFWWRPGARRQDPQEAETPPPNSRRPSRLARFTAAAAWAYVAFTLALFVFLRSAGDRWWVATLILFSPRWLYALPLALLVPAALLWRRRSLWPLLIGAVLVLFPIMDLCIPWHRAFLSSHPGPQFRVLTCNTHGDALEPEALARLLEETKPDLVSLQEAHPKFFTTIFRDGGWQIACDGELCLAGRYPIRKILDLGGRSGVYGAAVHYEVQTPYGPIQFYDVHLQSPHSAFRAALHGLPGGPALVARNSVNRFHQASGLAQYAQSIGGPTLLAGDFNLPADSPAYRQNLAQFADAFSTSGFGFGLTYRAPWTMTRIDHILSGTGWDCRRCWVAPSVGSPHQPLIADLQWVGAGQ